MKSPYELYRKYAVHDCETLESFMNRYHRTRTYRGRGEKYAEYLLASYGADFERDGFVFISRHDSNTGEVVSFYGPHGASEVYCAELANNEYGRD